MICSCVQCQNRVDYSQVTFQSPRWMFSVSVWWNCRVLMHCKTHMASFSLSPPPVHIQFRREAICSCCCHSDMCSSTSLRRRQYMITREKGKASLIWRFMVLIRRIEYHTILWSAHRCIKIPDGPWNLTSGVTGKHIIINILVWGWSVWRSSIDVHLDWNRFGTFGLIIQQIEREQWWN